MIMIDSIEIVSWVLNFKVGMLVEGDRRAEVRVNSGP